MIRKTNRRRGVVALIAVVCLTLIGTISLGLLRVGMTRKGRLGDDLRSVQAAWLVEAGFDRAAAQIEADPSFEGETWLVPAESLGGRPAEVRIDIEAGDDPKAPNIIRIRVDYPSDGNPAERTRRSRTFPSRPSAIENGAAS